MQLWLAEEEEVQWLTTATEMIMVLEGAVVASSSDQGDRQWHWCSHMAVSLQRSVEGDGVQRIPGGCGHDEEFRDYRVSNDWE
ncbi:hypothetical protein MRB53_018814 [Persea americana]|uniref:Uncharacterized protein n=1 Tax=Persea americana TaxID=3435 RepID=A0ACC2M907_PERAE|nr:hypothetical protein MRB53_018814 [Persea americana]